MARAGKNSRGRRARGTGSIFYSEKRGLWVGRRIVGRSAGGFTSYQEVTAFTQGGVIKRLAEIAPPSATTTLADWGNRWLASLSVRPSTQTSYRNSLRYRIIPSLGHLAIASITPHDIEQAVRDWGKHLSANTVRLTVHHAQILFSAAIRAEIIARNPVRLARRPRAAKVETAAYTAAELRHIILSCLNPPRCALAILAATGMRQGELVALDVGDFNRQTGELSITKGFTKPHGIGPTKSPHSERTVKVPAIAIPALVAAINGRKSGPLFLGREDRQSFSGIQYQWEMCCEELGLNYQRPHALRHSVGSVLIAAGVGLGDVAKFLGDTVATVVKTYIHPTEIQPTDTLDSLFSTPRKVSLR